MERKKILLLGSGELGKEFTIAMQRLGQYVVAVDSYEGAPAMQVAHEQEVIDMLDGDALDRIVGKHQPDLVVPEIEAIRTERLFEYEKQGIQVVPSAKAANYTMNRKAIRDLAAQELGVTTAPYQYATSAEEIKQAAETLGYPCIVKPLMSSSGKGQSKVDSIDEVDAAWNYAVEGSRGDIAEVIVEGFIQFDTEITLLTVTQHSGETLFCAPIGHRQEGGDYQESWQPENISAQQLEEAQEMARRVTNALEGAGIWGVEFFITPEKVYFSELSPRPHDTGMVTLANTQNLNQFELHARAVLGWPIQEISLLRNGASAAILARENGLSPQFEGIDQALSNTHADLRIFGKPTTRPNRRMAVITMWNNKDVDAKSIATGARELADKISVTSTASND